MYPPLPLSASITQLFLRSELLLIFFSMLDFIIRSQKVLRCATLGFTQAPSESAGVRENHESRLQSKKMKKRREGNTYLIDILKHSPRNPSSMNQE